MMDDCSKTDLISDLPQSIQELILTKLPLRDVVKTSILSSKWRYKWTSITNLVFNDECVHSRDWGVAKKDLVNFITRFLFLHDGPIHEFSLSSGFLPCSPDLDQWLLFLSRKGVKKLLIELGNEEIFRAPTCVFSFSKLTHLELVHCEIDLPEKFKGFLCLTYLSLRSVLISSDDIDVLISRCPLLESLILVNFDGLELSPRAPNLKHLTLEGEFMDICLQNTPQLVSAFVSMYYVTDHVVERLENFFYCNFDKLLGGVPGLEKLVGQIYFTKYISIGIDTGRKPIKYQHLKTVELDQVNFEDLDEVLAVIRLIANSPNLEELRISSTSNASADMEASDLAVWEKECPINHMFNHLRRVEITEVCGIRREMDFIKFLLNHTPELEQMTVVPSPLSDGELSMSVSMLRFRRASAKADVIFIPTQPH